MNEFRSLVYRFPWAVKSAHFSGFHQQKKSIHYNDVGTQFSGSVNLVVLNLALYQFCLCNFIMWKKNM